MLGDEGADSGRVEVAFAGDARDLEFGGGRGNFGVESGARARDQVDGDWRVRIFGLEFFHVGFNAIEKLVIGGSEVRTGGLRGVVAGAGGRFAGVKIGGAGKRLTQEFGADDLAVFCDQAAVGLVREEELGDSGHGDRIEESKDDRGGERDKDGRAEIRDQ